MSEIVRCVLGIILIVCGIAAGAIGILGVYRFHFVMNRMHCAALIDTLTMSGLFGGLILLTWDLTYIPKLLAVLMVLWIGSPAASHLVGEMEISIDESAPQHLEIRKEDSNGSV